MNLNFHLTKLVRIKWFPSISIFLFRDFRTPPTNDMTWIAASSENIANLQLMIISKNVCLFASLVDAVHINKFASVHGSLCSLPPPCYRLVSKHSLHLLVRRYRCDWIVSFSNFGSYKKIIQWVWQFHCTPEKSEIQEKDYLFSIKNLFKNNLAGRWWEWNASDLQAHSILLWIWIKKFLARAVHYIRVPHS